MTIETELYKLTVDWTLARRDVVAFARDNPDSALHKEFEWDDAKAAAAYRYWQACAISEGGRIGVVYDDEDPTADRARAELAGATNNE